MNATQAVQEPHSDGSAPMDVVRKDKELLDATRPFAEEFRLRSWWCVASTFLAMVAVLSIAAVSQSALRVIPSILGGLLFVRAFILYHDFLHGSLLRGSRLAKGFFLRLRICGTHPAG